ncbi:MAG: Maf family protein [Elusimicrobiota bacterium]
MKKIILASASPRRKQLLKQLGLKYVLHPSHVSEHTAHTRPSSIVIDLAKRKAFATAKLYKKGIVIGADTIVVLNGRIIGKPRNKKDAARILGMLSGTFHRVYTGIAVVDARSGRTSAAYEMSRVKMRKISKDELGKLSAKHLDKAGAYAVQETDDAFVEKIEGDYFNVVGLPVKLLVRLLKKFGVDVSASRLAKMNN